MNQKRAFGVVARDAGIPHFYVSKLCIARKLYQNSTSCFQLPLHHRRSQYSDLSLRTFCVLASPRHIVAEGAARSFEDDVRTWTSNVLIRVVTSDIEDFSAANESDLDHDSLSEEQRAFFNLHRQPFSMSFYVQRLVTYCNCSAACFIGALIYLDRVQVACRVLSLTEQNSHRLLSTALLIAIKYLDDEHCSNSYYASVFGIDIAEMNSLELTFLGIIEWRLYIEPSVYALYENPLFQVAAFLESNHPD